MTTTVKKSLLFAPAWYPNKFDAGSGSFNRTIAGHLAKRYETTVLYLHFHDDASEGTHYVTENYEGAHVLRSYVYRRARAPALFPLLYLRHFLRAYALLRGEGRSADLVYARGVLPSGIGALALRRLHGVPYVTAESFSGFAQSMQSRVKRGIAGRVLAGSKANAAVSSFQREVMTGIFPRAKIEVLPNVIEESEPANLDPGDIEEGIKLAYVGNIAEVKGWDVLLDAVALYTERYGRGVRLTMAGGGDEDALRAKIEALGLGDVVKAVGPQPHEEAVRIMSRSHCLVLPSRVDTCPNVVLEAQMEGRLVLATRSGGAVDLVNEANGILVEAGSAEALCEGIREVKEKWGGFDAAKIHAGVVKDHGLESLYQFLELNL